MHAKITNNSRANQGVYTTDGLQFIAPGKTRTLTIAEDYVERATSLPFLKVVPVEAGDPVDLDTASEVATEVLTDADDPELIDAMDEPELHDFIERKTGHRAHPNTGHDKLVAKAKEAAATEA